MAEGACIFNIYFYRILCKTCKVYMFYIKSYKNKYFTLQSIISPAFFVNLESSLQF